jgi:hypothetical protein
VKRIEKRVNGRIEKRVKRSEKRVNGEDREKSEED